MATASQQTVFPVFGTDEFCISGIAQVVFRPSGCSRMLYSAIFSLLFSNSLGVVMVCRVVVATLLWGLMIFCQAYLLGASSAAVFCVLAAVPGAAIACQACKRTGLMLPVKA